MQPSNLIPIVFFFGFSIFETGSQCHPGWLRIHYVAQVGLQSWSSSCLSLPSAGITDMNNQLLHTYLEVCPLVRKWGKCFSDSSEISNFTILDG